MRRAIGTDSTGALFRVRLARDGDAIAFPVPTAHVAAVVLAEQVEPEHGLLGGIRLLRDEPPWRVRIAVANLSAKTASGTVAIRAFGPFRRPPKDPAFSCPPGRVVHPRCRNVSGDPSVHSHRWSCRSASRQRGSPVSRSRPRCLIRRSLRRMSRTRRSSRL